jgi:membrane protein involved in colicin uptake
MVCITTVTHHFIFTTLHSGVLLNCGLHRCPSRCHQTIEHSKLPCKHRITWQCEKGHNQAQECRLYNRLLRTCTKCANEAKKAEAKLKREAEQLERKRQQEAEQLAHDEKMAELNAKIDVQEQAVQNARLVAERENALKQKQKDLKDAAARAQQLPRPTLFQGFTSSSGGPGPSRSGPTSSNSNSGPADKSQKAEARPKAKNKPDPNPISSAKKNQSPSQEEWERQKRVDGANNEAVDSIMDMIGLEDVKSQVLKIKHKIDVVKRQNATLNDERFSIVLQGNPGTGYSMSYILSRINQFYKSR